MRKQDYSDCGEVRERETPTPGPIESAVMGAFMLILYFVAVPLAVYMGVTRP